MSRLSGHIADLPRRLPICPLSGRRRTCIDVGFSLPRSRVTQPHLTALHRLLDSLCLSGASPSMESASACDYDTRFPNATEERMIVPRRRFPHLAALAAALLAVSPLANAQGYPSRPARIVVGFPPGQAIDISARLMAEWLQQRLGQTFIVENRPGAAANVATEMVARSPADGYTLLVISSNNVINTTLYGTVDFAREIAPIAAFGRGYQVLNVNNSLPVKTVPDLIALAKADPGKLSMAS